MGDLRSWFEGFKRTPLARIPTKGGDVLHAMRSNDPGFSQVEEAYFSCVDPGAVKAWKKHTRMTSNLIVPVGRVRFVLFEADVGFRVEEIGEATYCRLTVPPGLWLGFMGCGSSPSLVLNLADMVHDPSEVMRREVEEIEFDWSAL